ncbi:MAG: SMC-Scp complex subunit ScpB [Bacilli bacterium]|nr:SMC-Scp complex subunit ScpB [Bacilli bacterium]
MKLKGVIEGLLFVSGDEGLTKKALVDILEINEEEVNKLIKSLKEDYDNLNRGIKIEEFGDILKLVTKQEYKDYMKKLVPDNEDFLTQANLETLAIIAYNQPITRMQIEEIRGVSTSHIIRKLLIRDLIKELGRSELPGKPILYGTSDYFLDYFKLSSLEELPNIELDETKEEEKNLFESRYKENEF